MLHPSSDCSQVLSHPLASCRRLVKAIHLPVSCQQWCVQVISEDVGLSLDKVEPHMLGSAKKVTISKDDTIILDGAGEKSAIQERGDQIREAMENSTSDYDRYSSAQTLKEHYFATTLCRDIHSALHAWVLCEAPCSFCRWSEVVQVCLLFLSTGTFASPCTIGAQARGGQVLL